MRDLRKLEARTRVRDTALVIVIGQDPGAAGQRGGGDDRRPARHLADPGRGGARR
ncbi:MAG: hypothetical protein R2939_06700 [Kofleriaceae bacterium]